MRGMDWNLFVEAVAALVVAFRIVQLYRSRRNRRFRTQADDP